MHLLAIHEQLHLINVSIFAGYFFEKITLAQRELSVIS